MLKSFASNLRVSQPASGATSPETLLFLLKRGVDLWELRLQRDGFELSGTLRELTWEMIVLCCEFLESEQPAPNRETYRLATEIGRRCNERLDRRDAVTHFRDELMACLLEALGSDSPHVLRLMTFFIAVGDAIWETYAEMLRSNIRQEKRQRLTEQLRVAKRIQQHLLPKSIPDIPGFEIEGRLVPAEEVGGDYWSAKSHPQDGIVTVKLADITGHGIAAATLVAAVKFISGGFYRGSSDPAEVMQQTNRVLCRETPSDILVSMVYGWLYPETRVIRLVNAGHHPAFIAAADGFRDIQPTGPVMGLHECSYEEVEEHLQPGDLLVFASDGVTEAGMDRPFGADRLKQVVWDHRRQSAKAIAEAVIDAIYAYDVAISDDLSVLVVKAVDAV